MVEIEKKEKRLQFLLFSVFVILVIVFILIGILYYKSYERKFHIEIENQLSAVAELKSGELLQWRKNRLGDGMILYNNEIFSMAVERFFRNHIDIVTKSNLQNRLIQFQKSYNYYEVYLLDSLLIKRISSSGKQENNSEFIPQNIIDSVKSGKVILEDFYRDEIKKKIFLRVLVPISGSNAEFIGIVVLQIDPETYLYPLLRKWFTLIKTSETFIIRREEKEVVYLNHLKFQDNAALNLRIPLEKKDVPSVKVALGLEGVVNGIDYRGNEVIAYIRPVPNSPWLLVAKIDLEEVGESLSEIQWLMTILVIGFILSSAAGIGFIWRKKEVKFYKERLEYALAIETLTTRQDAIVVSVPDIIMEVDNNKTYIWANEAGKEFFGDDVVGKEASYYFEGEQNTYKTVQPLFEGSKDILYVESYQRRKDGQIRLLSWWCKSLKDVKGNILSVISTARDITEHKLAEKSLIELQKAVDASGDIIFITDKDGLISSINAHFTKLYGYTTEDVIGKTTPRILKSGKQSDQVYNDFWKFILDGNVFSGEVINKSKDGKLFYIEETVNPILSEYGKVTGFLAIQKNITERKLAEELVKQEITFSQSAINSMPGLFYVFDIRGKFLRWNKNFEAISGYTAEDISVMTPLDFFGEKDKQLISDRIAEVFQKGTSFAEADFITKDGKAIPFYFTGNFITLDGKNCVIGVGIDISERKRIEEQLRNSEITYREITDNISEAIYIYDEQGRFLNVNSSAEIMYGYDAEHFIGKTPEFLSAPGKNDMEVIGNRLKDAFMGIPQRFEFWGIKKDGTVFPKEISLTKGHYFGKETIVAVARDITERKKAEEEIQKFQRAVENSPASIVFTDVNGNIEFINNKFTEITGRTMEEVIGKKPNICKSGYHDNNFYKDLWDTILSGKEWKGEIRNKKKNGELHWESEWISSLKNDKNEITHFIAVRQDITEYKQMQEALLNAKEKAEMLNKLKDAFIANVSHEIRTPLNGLIGMTHLIKNSLSEHITINDMGYFEAIDNASSRIIRTVEMILNFSRIQSGDFPLTKEEFSLLPVLENLINEHKSKAEEKSLKISIEHKCGNVLITGDKYTITQSISNLIDNAIKYTNEGDIKLVLYSDSDYNALLDIIDSGIGISKEYLKFVFEPYSQEQYGYSRGYEGVGLGLSLVKRYLDLNDAEIFVISKKGVGSTFTILFNNSKVDFPT